MSLDMVDEEDRKDYLDSVAFSGDRIFSSKNRGENMLDTEIVIYCICDEVWKVFAKKDDPQCKMTSPEIMAFSVIAAHSYNGNYQRARLVSLALKFFSKILSLSQLVRRIHQIPYEVWMMVFTALQIFLRDKDKNIFIIDSFPVPAYQNHKSFRARIFATKEYHGYTASKKQYFFGIKVHMIVDVDGVPIEFLFTPGSVADIAAVPMFSMHLPANSLLLGDRAYTNYALEDFLAEAQNILMIPKRKLTHQRQHSSENNELLKLHRNRIETVFSSIVSRMSRRIHVRTEKGFCLKILFHILAYMVALYLAWG